MGQVDIDGKGADTIVRVASKDLAGWDSWQMAHIDHDSFGKLAMQWFRQAPKDVISPLLAKLFFEHQLAVTLQTKTEEDRLQELNMDEENVMDILVETMLNTAQAPYDGANKQLAMGDLGKALHEQHFDLPPLFVWGVMKGLEFYHPEFTLTDIGEGFVSIKDASVKQRKMIDRHR